MNNSPIYKCRLCTNASFRVKQEMKECCYDDFNLLEYDISCVIKIQNWYKKIKLR